MSSTATSAPATTVTKKTSWLTKIGQVIGKVVKAVATDAGKVADLAKPVAIALLPQFSSEITTADNLIDNIALEAQAVEGTAAAASTATTGQAKLEAVLTNIGPDIDQWVAAKFPGATTVSNAAKAGLVNAVVAIMNEVDGSSAGASPASSN